MPSDRRLFLTSLGALAAAPLLPARALAQAQAGEGPAFERFPIWPGSPPGLPKGGVREERVLRSNKNNPDDFAWPHVATPMLTVCPATKPTGAAVLMFPGGGYARVAMGTRPSAISRWFAGQGVTAFELLYRLPHDGWAAGPDTPLQDAQPSCGNR